MSWNALDQFYHGRADKGALELLTQGRDRMKRIVVLIDGTWNKEGSGADTNVAKLDSAKKIQPFIQATAANGTVQHMFYHDGVGSEGDFVQRVALSAARSRKSSGRSTNISSPITRRATSSTSLASLAGLMRRERWQG
jgi:uncharacterized protein (DUF2235 family)